MNGYFTLSGIARHFADKRPLDELIAAKLLINKEDIADIIVLRESLDARKRSNIHHLYSVAVRLNDSKIPTGFPLYEVGCIDWCIGEKIIRERPIIVGCGPAGLFAAYGLVKKGYKPILIEQGKRITERDVDTNLIKSEGKIDSKSNFVFGEGGAGTYSDGKLTARNTSPVTDEIYKVLIGFGASPAIAWQARPHIGTDALKQIIPAMVDYLNLNGTTFLWSTSVNFIESKSNGVVSVKLSDGEALETDALFLATGHSADAVYEMLFRVGVPLGIKPFAVGVRIEHPRGFIDKSQYGDLSLACELGAASYKLTGWAEKNRGVYSFCVCPGGEIINASSEDGRLAVNGMSYGNRGEEFTNGAIVVTVLPTDLPNEPLEVLRFRRDIERKSYREGMVAPAQSAINFIGRKKDAKSLRVSYKPAVYPADLSELFPHIISQGLITGLTEFNRKIRGFVENGVLVAPETGTSSPIRILRNVSSMESCGFKGLYPIGEGAGYSGGIISSAADGLKASLNFKSFVHFPPFQKV